MKKRPQIKSVKSDLIEAAEMMLEHYISLVDSGDCGNWNPHDEVVVKNLKRAIRHAKNSGVKSVDKT